MADWKKKSRCIEVYEKMALCNIYYQKGAEP